MDNQLSTLRAKCESIQSEIRTLLALIEKELHIEGISKRIDTFFYFEANYQVMRIYGNLDYCWEVDREVSNKVEAIQNLVRTQWQKDHMFIACPPSLHPYLEEIPCYG